MINNQNDINVFATGELAGKAAGKAVEDYLVSIQDERHTIRIIFAAAPSQRSVRSEMATERTHVYTTDQNVQDAHMLYVRISI